MRRGKVRRGEGMMDVKQATHTDRHTHTTQTNTHTQIKMYTNKNNTKTNKALHSTATTIYYNKNSKSLSHYFFYCVYPGKSSKSSNFTFLAVTEKSSTSLMVNTF